MEERDMTRDQEAIHRLRADLEEALERLRETTDALSHAFCFEDVPLSQHQYEIQNGRWSGVRAIVEQNEEFLNKAPTR